MKRAIACASVLAFVCLFSITALGANTEQVVLRVGQVESSPSLPTEFMESFRPGMQIVPAYQSRSEVWPSTTPLPSALTELPDVVSVLVGFYDNDIPSLCEAEALEPLDSLLEEAGINPAEDLPAEVRAAVTWQGKTWAIPYRIESFVLQYRLSALQRVGATPMFETWDGMLGMAERLSFKANPDTQISGFSPVRMPDEQFGAFLMSVSLDVAKESPRTFAQLLSSYQERKVIQPDNFSWRDPMHDDGVGYLLSRLVTVDSDIQVAQIPPALLAAQSKTIRPLGLMQCFAVRKNSPEKLAAARQFLKTLASKETQLRLLKAAAINTPQHSYSLRFIPVFRQVRESEEFKQFQAAVPAYKVLMDSRMAAHFTPTDKVLFTQPRDAVLARVSAIEDK